MTNVLISLLSRLLSLVPLSLIFYSVFRTYWDKRHSINGLRRTRVMLMALLLALLIDNVIFFFVSLCSFIDHNPVIVIPTFWVFFDKLVITSSFFGFYYLFRHASKKD